MLSESCLHKKPMKRTSDKKNSKTRKTSPWCLSPSCYTFIKEGLRWRWQRRKAGQKSCKLTSGLQVGMWGLITSFELLLCCRHPFLSPPFSPAVWKLNYTMSLKFLKLKTLQHIQSEWELLQYDSLVCEVRCPADQRGFLPGCPEVVKL